MTKTLTLLITGAAGYVASHCIAEFLSASFQDVGFTIIAVDNLKNSSAESITRLRKLTGCRILFYHLDIGNIEGMRRVFRQHPSINIVVHFAAFKAVSQSVQHPLMYYENNVSATITLLKVMAEFKVSKIVFSSSATVYGNPSYLPIDERHLVGNCCNPYGRTKYFMEEIIRDVCKADENMGAMLLRYFNPVGAHPSGVIGEDPCGIPGNLMPYIAQVAVGRLPHLVIYGDDYDTPDGTGIRDYIHVMDVAKGHFSAVIKLAEDEFRGLMVFNLGTGKGSSVLEVVKAFEKACGVEIPYVVEGRREGDVQASYCSADLAQRVLGWKSSLTLEEVCRDMWNWQKQNPKGYNL